MLQILCSDKAKVFFQISRALSLTLFITMHIMSKTHIFFGTFGQRNVLFCFHTKSCSTECVAAKTLDN